MGIAWLRCSLNIQESWVIQISGSTLAVSLPGRRSHERLKQSLGEPRPEKRPGKGWTHHGAQDTPERQGQQTLAAEAPP